MGFEETGLDLFHRAIGQITKLERAEGNADQPVHLKAEMLQYAFDFAVFAFAQAERQPDIVALFAIQGGFNRAVIHAVNGDAAPQTIEHGLADFAVTAHPIPPEPSGFRQLDDPGQTAIIGQ